MFSMYTFEVVEVGEKVVCVPIGEEAEQIKIVLAFDFDTYDDIVAANPDMSSSEIAKVLVTEHAGEMEFVEVNPEELTVIRDLSEKASKGQCSQYTYQLLVKMLGELV